MGRSVSQVAGQGTTKLLGGTFLGFGAQLEERARTGYLPATSNVMDLAEIK